MSETTKERPVLCEEVCDFYTLHDDKSEVEAFGLTVAWAQENPDYEGQELKTIKAVVRGRLMSRDVYRKLPASATAKPTKKRTTPSKADLTKLCYPDKVAPATYQNMAKIDLCKVGLEFPDLPVENYESLTKYRDILQIEKDESK